MCNISNIYSIIYFRRSLPWAASNIIWIITFKSCWNNFYRKHSFKGFCLDFHWGKSWCCWTLNFYICMGWKMRCEVILQRNEMRSEITKYYFHRTRSINECSLTCSNDVSLLSDSGRAEDSLDIAPTDLSPLPDASDSHACNTWHCT